MGSGIKLQRYGKIVGLPGLILLVYWLSGQRIINLFFYTGVILTCIGVFLGLSGRIITYKESIKNIRKEMEKTLANKVNKNTEHT